MKVIFGMWLDSLSAGGKTGNVGEIAVGPQGMLTLLESRMGLTGDYPSNAIRIAQFQSCLFEVDNGARFYSKSLRNDAFAVAETLLGWRDRLIESGWSGEVGEMDSRRLQDMAAVEASARNRLSPGNADRLRALNSALPMRGHGITEVELAEPYELLSPAWQSILSKLPLIDPEPLKLPTEESDLSRLQRALTDKTRFTPQNDGSVLILSAQEEDTLATATAFLLHANAESRLWPLCETTVITGDRGDVLDAALAGNDLPAIGDASNSPWRSPLLVLRLALAQFWSPLDPYRLLQFLTHPVTPIPHSLARRLADVVAANPGKGGEDWQATLSETYEAAGERRQEYEEAVAIWLEQPTFDPVEGVPLIVVTEHAARVNRWAAGQSAREGISEGLKFLFRKAAAQARDLCTMLDAVQKAGQERVSRLQLERLLERATDAGGALPDSVAEIGSIAYTRHSGGFTHPVERIVWWGFTDTGSRATVPWSQLEIEQLRARNTTIEPYEHQLEREAWGWRRAVLATSRQLVLVLPKNSRGQPLAHHPLWDHISALISEPFAMVDIDQSLVKGNPDLPLQRVSVALRSLPQRHRWWQVTGELPPRAIESFSSLNTFINEPYEWVLKYNARLQEKGSIKVSDGNQLKGNLAHRLFEWLFGHDGPGWKEMHESDLTDWVHTRFHVLLEQEGATLLMPGRVTEREELLDVLQRATKRLVEGLRQASVVEVHMESPVEGRFTGGALAGRIDMLVRTADVRYGVSDIKWSGGNRRQEEMSENRHLQLALYGELLRQSNGHWPEVAFFVVDVGQFYAPGNTLFTSAKVCEPAEGENIATLWQGFEKSWRWRREQLDKGWIEIPVEGTEPDERSVAPDDGLAPLSSGWTSDYAALTGWGDDA